MLHEINVNIIYIYYIKFFKNTFDIVKSGKQVEKKIIISHV